MLGKKKKLDSDFKNNSLAFLGDIKEYLLNFYKNLPFYFKNLKINFLNLISNLKKNFNKQDKIPQKRQININSSKSLEFGRVDTKRHGNNNHSHSNKFKEKFSNILDKLNLSGSDKKQKRIYYIGGGALLSLLLILWGTYVFFNASSYYSVSIAYEYKNLSSTKEIEAGQNSEFQITKLETSGSISAFIESTGEKTVGEKAKGRITVFNATSNIVVIPAGTQVRCVSTSCDGLIYTSLNEVNLGPGNSVNNYEIIASDMGENYNLQVNAGRFKVGNFDSNTQIVASNIETISGGTPKKTVKIVTAEDIKNVENKALEDIKTTLIGNINTNSTYNSQYIIANTSVVVEKISSETDKEGTEANVVNTSLVAKGTVDAISKELVNKAIEQMKTEFVPDGYYSDENNFVQQSPIITTNSNGNLIVKLNISGIGRINLNKEKNELIQKLAGKSIKDAEIELSKLENIKSYKTTFTPDKIPTFLRKVPKATQRIKVEIIHLAPSE